MTLDLQALLMSDPEPALLPLIEVRDLTKRYGRYKAVDRVSFTVSQGAIFGFVGPNGAGKTTTLKIMATLLDPTEGQVLLGGYDVGRQAAQVRNVIGYMPDFFGVYDDLTVLEYLDFYARAQGVPGKRRLSLLADLLQLVDLTYKRDAYVETLSRGMKQRLCLARCLVNDPRILILDEPASGLDPRARLEMRELLKELQRMGKTIIISSHILPELAELCTEIGIVDRGHFLAGGPVAEVVRRYSQHARLEIQLSTEGKSLDEVGLPLQLAQAATLLKDQPGLTAGAEPQVEVHRALLSVEFAGSQEQLRRILVKLLQAGLPVIRFSLEQPDLEDIFMRITNQTQPLG